MRNPYDPYYDQDDYPYGGLSDRGYGQVKQLRLTDILYALRKRFVLILVLTIIGLVAGVILSLVSYMRGEMQKQYTITSSIVVTSQASDGMFVSKGTSPGSTDIHLAEDMVDSVIYILRSDKLMNKVMDRLQILGITSKDITNNLKLQRYNETQIIEMTLYWHSSKEGTQILSTIMELAPSVLIETLKIGNITVVNEPNAKYVIGGSLSASMWIYMAVLGAMIGIGIAVLELLLHPTLLNCKDAESVLELEILGEIPFCKPFFRKKRNLLITDENEPNGEIIDHIQSLCHIVKRNLKNQAHPIIYVTSAAPEEGKTSTTAYMAVYLAELGMKVLAIDFDTRNPKLGGMFLQRVNYEHSLNALYRGETTKENAITNLTGNLDLLPAVLERHPLPIDEGILDMVNSFRADYDVILMDTAPVGRVANTMSLNELADVALFVIRYDATAMDEIRSSLSRLDKSGIPLMGCIINGVKQMGYKDMFTRYNASDYGYDAEKEEAKEEKKRKRKEKALNKKKRKEARKEAK